MIEAVGEVLPSVVGEVLLASGDFGGELLGLAVVPGPVGQEVLLVEGARLVVAELVVPHNKIMSRTRLIIII